MDELKCYETYARGNINENEIIPIKIFMHGTIYELTIKQIKTMPFYKVQRLGKVKGWQVLRLDD